MTWTKTGDEFADECWTLSDAAYRLHHEGLTWSNRKATNGQLAKDDMRRWARRPEAAEELVNIGWWEDHGQHYQIIHHMGYQRTKEQAAHQSNVNAANRAKGKARPVRAKSESHDGSSDESSDKRDRTGQAWIRNRGTSLEREVCEDCQENPPVGDTAQGNDSPNLCRSCNDARLEDLLADAEIIERKGS